MKKLGLLIMPIMAISFLVGCNNGGGDTPEPELYTMTFSGNNCKANNEKNYAKGTEVNFTITADSGFVLPNEISVDGTTTYQYNCNEDKVTATFSCTMPTNDVTVTVEALQGYKFEFRGINCTANNEEIYAEGAEVSFEITPNDSFYMLPQKLSSSAVSGIKEYEYTKDEFSGTATFSCVMENKNVSMRVEAKQDPAQTLYVTTSDKKPIPTSIEAFESFEIIACKQGGDPVDDATFTSSNPEVLSITEENGTVTVKGESGGSAVITCKAEHFVTVTTKPIEVIPLVMRIEQDDHEGGLPTSMYAEEKFYLAAYHINTEVEGAEFSTEDKTITIEPEGDKVALIGVSEGYGKIVCKAKGYRDAEAYIYVNDLKDMSIKLSTSEDVPSVIDVNTTEEIAAYDGNIQLTSGVTFTSSDESIINFVSDANGVKIKGLRFGTATITASAKAIGYKDATCTIEIRDTFDVTCSNPKFELSNSKASTDQDYKTTITLDQAEAIQDHGYGAPDKDDLTITVAGGNPITDYTYERNDGTFSAELVIPKQYITGPITIALEKQELTPLCFTSNIDNNNVRYRIMYNIQNTPDIEYSIDECQSWVDWPTDEDGFSDFVKLQKDDNIYIRNNSSTLSEEHGFVQFWADDVKINGNVNSMINYEALTPFCFVRLFTGIDDNATGAPALPATTLAGGCYDNMFDGCNFLTTAPTLPATTLPDGCYFNMFDSCINLVKAPKLLATTLSKRCCEGMFSNCSKLTEAPELPATTLAERCYFGMFEGCSKLNYIKVGFGTSGSQDWPSISYATDTWLSKVANKGTFVWKGSESGPATRGANTVPNGWDIVSI